MEQRDAVEETAEQTEKQPAKKESIKEAVSIFRAYDVRGKYPDGINEDIAYLIGRAFATIFCKPGSKSAGSRPGVSVGASVTVAVGGDSRLSTPAIKDMLIQGLIDSGADVADIGMAATPVVYFAAYKLGYDYGIAVTGSHLGKEFNGMKFCDSNGIPISFEGGLEKIKELTETKRVRVVTDAQRGTIKTRDVSDDYVKFMSSLFPLSLRGMTVVVDGANGAAGKLYARALRAAGADVIEMYCEPDGNFPNHTPDPMDKEFIVDLQRRIKAAGADVGMGFDGDGDRINFVDERGGVVDTNHIFSLMIEDALKEKANKGAMIVHDVLCSKLVDDVIEAAGGVSLTWRVGHTYIANKCFEEKALMAGEVSGHYFFKEANYADDVLVAGFKILKILKETGKSLSKLTKKYPRFYNYGDRVPVKEEEKFAFIEQLKDRFASQGLNIMTMDGVRVNFDNGWMLFRPSNTEAKISMGYESSDPKEFQKIKQMAEDIIKRIPKPKEK